MSKPLIIIGTGLAGYLFAKAWRQRDTETPLIMLTQDDGHFYSKPLLSNALQKQKDPQALITTPCDVMAEQLQASIQTHCTVTHIDATKQVITAGDTTYEYSHCVIATGAGTVTPPFSGDTDALWQVNSLTDYRPFHEAVQAAESIAIIGAGLVGCEFANDCLGAGKNVDIICQEPLPMTGFIPQAMQSALHSALTDAGASWHVNTQVQHIKKTSQGVEIHCNTGEIIRADCALAAIGIKAHCQLAKQAGLKVERGICVDGQLQTSSKNIYALGDAIQYQGELHQYIAPLMLQTRHLAKVLCDDQTADMVYPAMPVIVKTPCYPITCVTPPRGQQGSWSTENTADGIRALFKDEQGILRGFALSQACCKERVALCKAINSCMHEA